jgi:hypothetical protein
MAEARHNIELVVTAKDMATAELSGIQRRVEAAFQTWAKPQSASDLAVSDRRMAESMASYREEAEKTALRERLQGQSLAAQAEYDLGLRQNTMMAELGQARQGARTTDLRAEQAAIKQKIVGERSLRVAQSDMMVELNQARDRGRSQDLHEEQAAIKAKAEGEQRAFEKSQYRDTARWLKAGMRVAVYLRAAEIGVRSIDAAIKAAQGDWEGFEETIAQTPILGNAFQIGRVIRSWFDGSRATDRAWEKFQIEAKDREEYVKRFQDARRTREKQEAASATLRPGPNAERARIGLQFAEGSRYWDEQAKAGLPRGEIAKGRETLAYWKSAAEERVAAGERETRLTRAEGIETAILRTKEQTFAVTLKILEIEAKAADRKLREEGGTLEERVALENVYKARAMAAQDREIQKEEGRRVGFRIENARDDSIKFQRSERAGLAGYQEARFLATPGGISRSDRSLDSIDRGVKKTAAATRDVYEKLKRLSESGVLILTPANLGGPLLP